MPDVWPAAAASGRNERKEKARGAVKRSGLPFSATLSYGDYGLLSQNLYAPDPLRAHTSHM